MRFTRRFHVAVLVCGLAAVGPWLEAGPAGGHRHDHPTHGPHGGAVIELGKEDYHAELVHDAATDTVTIHILDSTATKAVPIAARHVTLNMRAAGKPRQFVLAAAPEPGASAASAFVATNRDLCQMLDAHGASGRLNVEVGGKVYVGKVESCGHAHPH